MRFGPLAHGRDGFRGVRGEGPRISSGKRPDPRSRRSGTCRSTLDRVAICSSVGCRLPASMWLSSDLVTPICRASSVCDKPICSRRVRMAVWADQGIGESHSRFSNGARVDRIGQLENPCRQFRIRDAPIVAGQSGGLARKLGKSDDLGARAGGVAKLSKKRLFRIFEAAILGFRLGPRPAVERGGVPSTVRDRLGRRSSSR